MFSLVNLICQFGHLFGPIIFGHCKKNIALDRKFKTAYPHLRVSNLFELNILSEPYTVDRI